MQAADDWQGTVGKAVENLDSGGFLVDRPGVAQLVGMLRNRAGLS